MIKSPYEGRMEVQMKKKLAYALAGIMLLSVLGGCGEKTESLTEEQGTQTEVKQEPEEKQADTAKEASVDTGKQITITWLNHMQEAGKKAWVEFVVSKFEEENPNIKVNIETVGADSYITVLQTKIASDDAPAVFDLYTNDDVKMYHESGYLYDLVDIESIKKIDEQLLLSGQINGVQLGVPMETSGYGVFYNKDIFDEYGITEPKTLTELYDICETLKEKGMQPFAAPMSEQWALALYARTVNDIISVMPDKDWYVKKTKLSENFSDDEDFKKAMEIYASFKPYWGNDPFGTSWDNAQDMVANGNAAMLIHGSWAVDGILSKNPDCNIGIFAMPVSDEANNAKMVKEPGSILVCFKNDDPEIQEAGAKLFNAIYSEESQKNYAEGAKQMPALAGNYDMLEPLKMIMDYPEEQSFMESGVQKFTNEYEDIFYEAIAAASMEETFDVEKLCTQLDKQFSAIAK